MNGTVRVTIDFEKDGRVFRSQHRRTAKEILSDPDAMNQFMNGKLRREIIFLFQQNPAAILATKRFQEITQPGNAQEKKPSP